MPVVDAPVLNVNDPLTPTEPAVGVEIVMNPLDFKFDTPDVSTILPPLPVLPVVVPAAIDTLPPFPSVAPVIDPAVIDTLPPATVPLPVVPLVDPADNVNAPPIGALPDPTVNDRDPPAPLAPVPDPR